jgi:hypothetical protein
MTETFEAAGLERGHETPAFLSKVAAFAKPDR